MRRVQLLLSALLFGMLLVACAPQAAPASVPVGAPLPATAPAPGAAPASVAKPAWETKWEKTLAGAKSEGRVMIASVTGAEPRIAVARGLENAYGIRVEAVGGRATEINAKILAERRAGLYLWDVVLHGTSSPLTQLKPTGALDPIEPTLIFPDVTDPEVIKKAWFRGELWWVDSAHTLLATLMFPHPPLAINTDLVKPDEIKSYNDILDPKWKGKITINDPTVAGTTFPTFIFHVFGPDWMRKLVKNEPIIIRDQRLQVDWLAHGKQPIALGVKVEEYTYFRRLGSPIQQVIPQEGTWLSADSAAVFTLNKRPHPNAASVFINWLLSKEGQTILSKASGAQSGREDVPTDFLNPEQIRQPGIKYWEKEREDICINQADDFKLAGEIFAPLMK